MDTPAVEARNLQKKYDNTLAVNGLDLKVERGEIFGLVGADGAGKTTTIRMLCTLIAPTAGEASVLGLDVAKQAEAIKEKIGYMSEKFNLYPTLTVEENIDFFARLRNIPRYTAGERKKELLDFCRLDAFKDRHSEHLSGGMQKKLALACSLIHEPEVLFLDEPTTGVDPVSRRDFWRIISGFLSRGITVIVSTPYLDEAERFDRVAFMHNGEVIACDTPQALKAGISGEILEVRAKPAGEAVAALGQAKFASSPQLFGEAIHVVVDNAEKDRAEIERLLKKNNIAVEMIRPIPASLEDAFVTRLAGAEEKEPGGKTLSAPAAVTGDNGPGGMAIEVTDLTRKFGSFTAVDRVNFRVDRGEIFGLLGPNGSGKTTTIRMITGLLKPTSGTTAVLGEDAAADNGDLRSRMGYMSQQFSLFSDLTVEENINLYGGLYGMTKQELKEGREWVLDMAGLRGKEDLMPAELSGGWKQRLALGCTIIHNPDVIFLDEPTAGVDPLSRRAFWELIQQLAAGGTTIFITTHYMDEAEHCHRLGLFYSGRLIALGSPEQLKTEKMEDELVEVISPEYAKVLEILSADGRFSRLSLFGSAIHVRADSAEAASAGIRELLRKNNIEAKGIERIPFTLEDVFISLVEEYEEKQTALAGSGKGA